jgi:hypothetical protein
MIPDSRLTRSLLLAGCLAFAGLPPVEAGTLRVPRHYPTIQDAVNAAAPGDTILVGPGSWCGATITKQLDLKGDGHPVIVGCPSPAPSLFGSLRIGFFLPDGSASGTTIRDFVFDGQGVSNTDLAPLAFAVFARDADDVIVQQNRVLGTVQSITNTRGDGWDVSHNKIEGLTVFTCDGLCGGGDAIVFQERPVVGSRGMANSATFNDITGAVPDTLNEFSMVGVLAIAQDGTVIRNNKVAIPDNPIADGAGEAIVITDHCCGLPTGFENSQNSTIINNDGRGSEFAVVIEIDSANGFANSIGTALRGNFGLNDINGSANLVRNRSIHTLVEFP